MYIIHYYFPLFIHCTPQTPRKSQITKITFFDFEGYRLRKETLNVNEIC